MNTPNPAPLTREAISARARQLWQIAGSPAGRDEEFWLAGQAELRLEQQQISTPEAQKKPRPRKQK
jgi:hypothetical protein